MIDVFENEPFDLQASDAKYLSSILRGNIERRDEGWVISRIVGQCRLPSGTEIRIRSRKASTANLFTWMAYVDPSLRSVRLLGELEDGTGPGDIGALVSILFTRLTLAAFHQHGLARNYLRVRVNRSTVRGRIDFAQACRRGEQLARTPCIVWERVPDTPLNRLLCEAIRRVFLVPHLREASIGAALEVQAVLSGVRPMVDPDLMLGRRPLQRHERQYELPLALARLIIRSTALTEGQEQLGVAFLINLEDLFEKAVVTAFRDAGVTVVPKAPVPYSSVRTSGESASTRREVMEMDLFLPVTPVGSIVVDAKYKTGYSSANLQQVVTYCYVSGATRAFLVFPHGHGEHTTRFTFQHAETSQRISVGTAELRTDGQTIAQWRENGLKLATDVLERERCLLAGAS